MRNLANVIGLNSLAQNEYLALDCLNKSDMRRFLQLLRDGMPLDAFMLTAMVYLGYSDTDIKEALQACIKHNDNIVEWMQGYFEVGELEELFTKYAECFSESYLSNEDCVKYKLWKVLHNRKQFDLIAQNAPEYLEKVAMYTPEYQALLKVDFEKYAPVVLKNGHERALLLNENGWKYLIDKGKGRANWLLSLGSVCDLLSKDEQDIIAEYCWQKGYLDELYINYRKPVLLKHKEFAVFVKHHSLYRDFLDKYPQEADWEDLWNSHEDERKYLIDKAFKHRNVVKCRKFLQKHGGLWIKLCLLFCK